jgi:beta-N-acetylhexosaminidase
MTSRQRVGQLFMVGVASAGPTTTQLARLQALNVGSVILDDNSHQSIAKVAKITSRLANGLTVTTARPFISTDQEGGEVQRLSGRGFSAMPTALAQGRLPKAELRTSALGWGKQLTQAGVNLNLAPVADTVPTPHAARNQPIGRYQREYGHRPGVVAGHVVAVVQGELAGGVDVTVKHFPGLGRATGNTDIARHVTDPTTRHDPYLQPFQAAVAAGAPFVMVSMATYPNIDPHHAACFSPTVMTTMLRHDLGFRGVIISDSFHARAVANVSPSQQAVSFFSAGGTMLLDTKVAPIHLMERATLKRAAASKQFAAVLKQAELTVLVAKAKSHLLDLAP